MSDHEEYMSVDELIEFQKTETREIIESLLADGSDPDALYDIEHHLLSEDFGRLEQAIVEAFKLGFEVEEAEEIEDESGQMIFCCDVVLQSALIASRIDEQAEQLIHLVEKYDIIYDGWGTYFEGDEAEFDDTEFDENK